MFYAVLSILINILNLFLTKYLTQKVCLGVTYNHEKFIKYVIMVSEKKVHKWQKKSVW